MKNTNFIFNHILINIIVTDSNVYFSFFMHIIKYYRY